jgi:hypothetical protein
MVDVGEDPFGSAATEVNKLDEPTRVCRWDGCSEPATHNVCQYDSSTGETLVDGVDADYCEPHARARAALVGEWEG